MDKNICSDSVHLWKSSEFILSVVKLAGRF